MPKIADWTEDTRRVLHVSLEGHFEPLQGQGNFMIDPRELEVTFERHDVTLSFSLLLLLRTEPVHFSIYLPYRYFSSIKALILTSK